MVSSRWIWALVAVTVVAGALRARPALDPNPRQSPDESGYVGVAMTLADTGRYGRESLHWPPGAPVAFAAAQRLDGRVVRGARPDIPGAYWVQWLAGTALIPCVFALAVLLGGKPLAGLLAAAVVATYPALIAVTGDLLSEPLGALWLTAAFVALAAARRTPDARGRPGTRARTSLLALAGVLLAAAVLTRANLLVVIPAIALTLGLRRGAVLAVAALVPVGAWSLNASAGSGSFVPVSTGGGTAFFVGTYLPGDGTLLGAKISLQWRAKRLRPELRRVHRARLLPAGPIMDVVAARHPGRDRDAALRAEAWWNLRTYPRSDPLGYVRMVLAKVPRLWLGASSRSDTLRTPAARIWHLLVVLAAIAGVVRLRDPTVIAALLAFTAFHMIVEAIPRYALPALPLLIAAGAAGWLRESAPPRGARTRRAPRGWPASRAPRPSRAESPSGSA